MLVEDYLASSVQSYLEELCRFSDRYPTHPPADRLELAHPAIVANVSAFFADAIAGMQAIASAAS